MTLETQFKLKSNPMYIKYLRENSHWYKILSRHPEFFSKFEDELKTNYKLRMSDRLTKTLEYMELIQSIISTIK